MTTDDHSPMPRPVLTGEAGGIPTARYSMDVLVLLGILALWVILQVWVLPKAGIPT